MTGLQTIYFAIIFLFGFYFVLNRVNIKSEKVG